LVAIDYYDGPTEGIVECSSCRALFWFDKLDWDDGQDVRIFSLAPIPGKTLDGIERSDRDPRTKWPTLVVWANQTELVAEVHNLKRAVGAVESVVATEDLLNHLLAWQPVNPVPPVRARDWFLEFGLSRRSKWDPPPAPMPLVSRPDDKAFVMRLVQTLPELQRLFDEHIKDNDELLPHVFMGDVTRFAVAAVHRDDQARLERLIGFLEGELSKASESVAELIGASFVENLAGEEEAIRAVVAIGGPALRKEVKAILGDEYL
jgi:hypothetical protein